MFVKTMLPKKAFKTREQVYPAEGEFIIEIKQSEFDEPETYRVFFDMIKKHSRKPVYYLFGIATNVAKPGTKQPIRRYNFELAQETYFPIDNKNVVIKEGKVGYISLSSFEDGRIVLYDRPYVRVLSCNVKIGYDDEKEN